MKDVPMNEETIHTTLHRLWTKAVGTQDYDKKIWLSLEEKIKELEYQFREQQKATSFLIEALATVRKFFSDLEENTELADPLRAIRRRIHTPLYNVIDTALAQQKIFRTVVNPQQCTCTPVAGSRLISIKDKSCPVHGEAKG